MPAIAHKRSIIIGDVHGCFDELQDLLKKCNFAPQVDRLILVGDLINKGPKSFATLKFVRDGGFEVTIGNHDLKFLKGCRKNKPLLADFEKLKGQLQPQLEDWLQWMETWPHFIETADFLVVHAGLVPGQHPSQTPISILANIRHWDGKGLDMNNPQDPAWHDLYKEKKLVVYGHWALQGLCVKENSIGLDSGCVYGHQLSALILPERKIVQVQAHAVYVAIPELP